MTSDGFIQKFKCRICAKGFPEIAGIDFQETFAPTKNSTSILTILAITAQHQLYLRQIDWIAAYLNGVMEHEVYMKMPDGTTRQMLKAFYGTRQGAERWHAPLLQAFINLWFTRTIADPSVFVIRKEIRVMIIGVHTDDGLIAINDNEFASDMISKLHNNIRVNWPRRSISPSRNANTSAEGATGPITID